MICFSQLNLITIISIISIIIYLISVNKNPNETEFNNKLTLLNEMILISKKNIKNKISNTENKIDNKTENNNQYVDQSINNQPIVLSNPNWLAPPPPRDIVSDRDRAVISDPLYPPLGRTERPIFDSLVNNQKFGLFNYPTRGSMDTFRLVGYLINSEDKKDYWKLFGRQKYPGSSIGEYYVIPIDEHKSDMKITLKDDMMIKDKIRDIYALPSEVLINSPLFQKSSYKIIELDKADLTSPYL